MNARAYRCLFTAAVFLTLTMPGTVAAAVCSSIGSGVWTAAIWGGACPAGGPTAADDVTINLAHAITFPAGAGAYAARSLTFSAPGGAASLTQAAGQTLTVGVGGATINSSSNTNSTKAWNINTGSATINGPVTFQQGSNSNNRRARINLSTGTLDINGNLTMSVTGSAVRAGIVATGAANIYLSGNFTLTNNLGTLTPGATSTFTYDSAAAATVATGSAIQYRNLVIDKAGGTATGAATGSLTVLGTLTVTAGTLSVANTVAVTGATSVSGTLSNLTTTGTKTFTGGVTINPGGTFSNNTVAEPMTIGGNFMNGGTFNSGTGTYTFNSAGQWGGANPIAFGGGVTVSAARTINTPVSVTGTLAVSGNNTVTNNSTVTAAGAITGTAVGSTWTNAANSTLNVAGALLATGTLNASASPNTVNYNRVGTQAIKLPSGGNYYHLTLSGGNTKTPAAGTYNILGNLTVNGGPTCNANTSDPTINVTGNVAIAGTYLSSNNAARPLTIGGNLDLTGTYTGNGAPLNLAGNFTHSGSFTSGSGVVTFNGNAAQTLNGTATNTTITNLTMNNGAAFADRKLTLGHDLTVSTLLTFNAAAGRGGRIVTGAAKVIVPSTGTITNASGSATESDFVAGRLQRYVAAGASTVAFAVGSDGAALPAAGYTPASLSFTGVAAGGGSLIVYVGAPLGDHPSIASSGLDDGKSVNRWWALTTSGVSGTALPAFASYSATFTFIAGAAPGGDLDSGANTANFEIERWNGSAWNTTTVGTRTGTTTQATGITALGECAIAEKKPVIPTPSDFNAFETSTTAGAITGQIYTKLIGTNFTLDVVAILGGVQHATFTDTVQADLVTGSTGGLNCPGTPVAIAGTSQNVNLTSGRGTTGNFNLAAAYPDVRVRVRFPVAAPTVTSCSTDNFSVRPTGLAVSSTDATNNDTSGTPAIKTGANFSLSAVAVAGYNGTPAIDNTKVAGSPYAGAIGGSFGAAAPATGTATGSGFYYSEAGNFGLNANAVYDSSFTAVDQPGDCSADFSNTPDGSGKYGCSFGSAAIAMNPGVSGFGRFIPDNFSVSTNTPAFATGCGTFTYTGMPFFYGTAPVITVTARNGTNNGLSNATTRNYAGAYMKLTDTSLTPGTQAARYARFDALGGGATPALDVTGLPAVTADPAIGTFTDGVGDLTFSSGTGGLLFARSTTAPHAPFDADIALAINVIDGDGIAYAGNPASFGAATAGNGIAFGGGKPVRYGRLRLSNASGSEKASLAVPVRAQFWGGSSWVPNGADSCTSLAAGAFFLSGTLAGSTSASAVTLVGGQGTLTLAAPSPVATGSVDVAANLGASGADQSCLSSHGGTAANKPWLRARNGNCAATYDRDPSARATFGIYTAETRKTIHIRESY